MLPPAESRDRYRFLLATPRTLRTLDDGGGPAGRSAVEVEVGVEVGVEVLPVAEERVREVGGGAVSWSGFPSADTSGSAPGRPREDPAPSDCVHHTTMARHTASARTAGSRTALCLDLPRRMLHDVRIDFLNMQRRAPEALAVADHLLRQLADRTLDLPVRRVPLADAEADRARPCPRFTPGSATGEPFGLLGRRGCVAAAEPGEGGKGGGTPTSRDGALAGVRPSRGGFSPGRRSPGGRAPLRR